MSIGALNTGINTNSYRALGGNAGTADPIVADVFTPSVSEDVNPMRDLSRLRRAAGNMYGNNAGQASGIERETFPCMEVFFVCNACA